MPQELRHWPKSQEGIWAERVSRTSLVGEGVVGGRSAWKKLLAEAGL